MVLALGLISPFVAGAAISAASTQNPHHVGGATPSSCHLGNGVKHVIEITFDNVHYFRDNPNVPSDLEMMPNLLNFILGNGTLLSNNHTPLIAHTADDSLTTYTGLYGDRQGMPVSNSYQAYSADGSTDPAGSFAYWTDPVFDTAGTPNAGHDTAPSMVYAASPPATAKHPAPTDRITPAPWVPFTRAGCNVGDVASANMVLENTAVDLAKVFGPTSPEVAQLNADKDSFKDAETADYVGLAIHCARHSSFCASAKAVKYGQTSLSPTAVTDALPTEPHGYHGFQALFGHRYIAPQLGAGTDNLTRNGYQVTNASGNLVDLNGNELDGAFLSGHPGFPGFSSINAAQSLAYVADMQEAGVPVTYAYISDIHGNEHIPGLSACSSAPSALGSGSPCYVAQAQYYNAAFGTFFQRLAADGITPANTEFIFSSDEGDHEAGANVGRAIQPTPSTCDGATVSGSTVTPDVACTYPAGTFGELGANIHGLLGAETSNTTSFTLENDTAPEFYVTGKPGYDAAPVRSLEHDVASLTASNPYSGNASEVIANYLADPVEEGILHMVNADPARTPTFSLFAKPDYYVEATSSSTCTNVTGPSSSDCIDQNPGFAWDHGDYAAEIDTNYLGLVGPGVENLGLDGSAANAGPSSAGAQSGQTTVPGSGTTGTWIDETDIRPTLMYLTGLTDDYESDGRVITEVLRDVSAPLQSPRVEALGQCYKQLNSSVGLFGTATLQSDTAAVETSSPGDATYTSFVHRLAHLEVERDHVAQQIKDGLDRAEFHHGTVHGAASLTRSCETVIAQAATLAAN
jgi:hypothetical protein